MGLRRPHRMSKSFYITTAIDYVNGHAHLGHAYEKIISDVIARAHRSFGEPVFFLTGLDEHGQKVQQSAVRNHLDPQAYCDQLAASWRAFADSLDLTINGFVRTTSPAHTSVVQSILSKLHKEDQFYQAEYKGFYSSKEETFLTERDRREDGTFDPFYGEVTELTEQNYYFKLKAHQTWLIDHIEANPDFIHPDYRRNEVLGFLKNNTLEDLCISRPVTRLNWGIPLPFDPQFVTYVWFDALVNYLSIPATLGDPLVTQTLGLPPQNNAHTLWPADAHVIGKDILKFHAVYWPIMLKAMGLPLPRQILVHGFWQKDARKISKTTGNIVEPQTVIDAWGLDAFRYHVVRELDIGPDGNWTDEGFAARYQAELANGLGNLVNRSLSMLKRYRDGRVPARHDELGATVGEKTDQTAQALRKNRLQGALGVIWSIIDRANQYVDQTAPFKLAKDPGQAARLDEVLYNLAETTRVLAILIWPILPNTAQRIWEQLALEGSPTEWKDAAWGGLAEGHVIGTPAPLFPRKET